MFQGRRLVIATKHKKESVLSLLFETEFGVASFVPENFDTDLFGTFSGEVDRTSDAVDTVRNKCLKAMELSNCDLGIASEGSFGSHPSVFFASANEEILIFIDKKNKLEIVVREISLATNFSGQTITNKNDLLSFLSKVKFPSHNVILKKNENDFLDIRKDFLNENEVIEGFNFYKSHFENPYIETDMRAMNNPTRMLVIEKAAKKLVEKIKSFCPECKTPGFGITGDTKGLRCELCNMPTKSVLSVVYQCLNCNFVAEKWYPNDKKFEDSTFCDFCNP